MLAVAAWAGSHQEAVRDNQKLTAALPASVATIAGSSSSRGVFADQFTEASLYCPSGLAVDSDGHVLLADWGNHRVCKIAPDGVVTTLAGSGTAGFHDGPGVTASFHCPSGLVVDSAGRVLLADWGNHRVRQIAPDGLVTTLAGSGTAGFLDGQGIAACFNCPSGLAMDSDGHVLLADWGNHCVRKISPDGVVTTLAGRGIAGFFDGQGVDACFHCPSGLAVDIGGHALVADWGNNRVRKIAPDGVVTTLAGSGTAGFRDGQGVMANFNSPSGLAVDVDGHVLLADWGNNRVRKLAPEGLVTTLAGSGLAGFQDGPATLASFYMPSGLAVGIDSNVLVADWGNDRVRSIVAGHRPAPLLSSIAPHMRKGTLVKDMAALYADLSLADVSFVVNGQEVKAHRCILSARSVYFRTMFASQFREGRQGAKVEVCDTSATAFRSLLRFLYTDELLVDDSDVVQLMRLAHRYEILPVYEHCRLYALRNLSAKNCIPWLVEAQEYGIEELRRSALLAVAQHLQSNRIQTEAKHTMNLLRDHGDLVMEALEHFA
mmetsp:Transcript_75130/g.242921  ORF Transcript_75130/g.242921 Transcript_75130/m.242921 type:complete len:546 (-) Transcript_75130:315-1952(-)